VVAAHSGSTWRRQYTVIGHTVNVGSRLCDRAGVGEVVLSESVRRASDLPLVVEALEYEPMKGVSDDFIAWRLILDPRPTDSSPRKTDLPVEQTGRASA